MPAGVDEIRVLAIGGGGGGQGGCGCGATSGHLKSMKFSVQAGTNYGIEVGKGGSSGQDGDPSYFFKDDINLFFAAGGKSGTGYECYEFQHPDGENWSLILSIIKNQNISEGPPGNRTGENTGGPGGGGIMINGKGPQAEYPDGNKDPLEGIGGHGYGAGGGASGPGQDDRGYHFRAGDGASGLVYIEWD